MSVQPWHWFVFGIILIIAEIYTATFAILWFGIAAIIVSIMLWIVPELMPTWQMQTLIWIIMSVFSAIFWFKFAQPIRSKRKIKEATKNGTLIGEIGMIIKPPTSSESGAEHAGVVRFNVPKVGTNEWPCHSPENHLKMGSKVVVVDVVDTELVVKFVPDV